VSGRGRWAGRLLRTAGALAVLAAAAGVVVGGTALPRATTTVPGPHLVAVPPAVATAVCPGPPVLPEAGGTGAFDPTPVDPVTTVTALSAPTQGASGPGGLQALADGASLAALDATAPSAQLVGPVAPVVLRAEPDGAPARVAGSTVSLVTAGDLRGLVGASCAAPTTDAWLVGGSTALGSTTQLVLTNPGSTAAEVQLTVWGPNGPVELTTPTQLVAPGGQRVVDLGGLAADLRALAVHLTATGGRVTALLQDGAVRGFTPAGVDLVVPGLAPATRLTVPGVVVEDSEVDSPDAPLLRLLAPGEAGTTARVTLLGPDGPVDLPGAASLDLVAGQVAELPLGGLAAGAYTVVVEADQPVVAGVVFTRTGLPGELDATPRVERAWAASTAPGDGLLVPAAGTDSTLVIGAVPADGDPAAEGRDALRGTLRLLGADGGELDRSRVSVDAGSTGSWRLADLVEAPADVRAVELVWDEGSTVASWALLAEHAQDDGTLVTLLEPVRSIDGPTQVAVRRDPAVGLP